MGNSLIYSIGFTELPLKFGPQVSKSGEGALVIRKNYNAGFEKKHCTIFSCMFCLMFLIYAIKHNKENKYKKAYVI